MTFEEIDATPNLNSTGEEIQDLGQVRSAANPNSIRIVVRRRSSRPDGCIGLSTENLHHMACEGIELDAAGRRKLAMLLLEGLVDA